MKQGNLFTLAAKLGLDVYVDEGSGDDSERPQVQCPETPPPAGENWRRFRLNPKRYAQAQGHCPQ